MKLWKDMTNEEKGALLLAHHQKSVIEYFSTSQCDWCPVLDNKPTWGANECYRVQPKTITHQVWWSPNGATVYRPANLSCYDKVITFTLMDDECIDVKVENI